MAAIIRTGTAAPKSSAGYDLTALLVGSEGTLGLITELTLRLHGQPEAVSAAVCAFADIGSAVDCVIATIQSGIPMARIEFLDQAAVAAVQRLFRHLSLPLAPHLLVEFHGIPCGGARTGGTLWRHCADSFGGAGFDWAEAPEDRNRLWKMRHHGLSRHSLRSRPGTTAIVTDVCVPISHLRRR